jgi:hypothetical protein
MQHLQPFSLFESTGTLTEEQERFIKRFTRGSWSVNPQTGLVDVQGSFDWNDSTRTSLPDIRFGRVTGYFQICDHLVTTLAGAPQTVGEDFYCMTNQLTSLAGAPQTVEGSFWCDNNQLTSLAGAPQTVGGNFYCDRNHLTSLKGAPQKIEKDFHCHINDLVTLQGGPVIVGGAFVCTDNNLTSLEGAPLQTVSFHCKYFSIEDGEWNPVGWFGVLTGGSSNARKLMATLPFANPQYWLELYRSNRQEFNQLWLGYRQIPGIEKSPLFRRIEQALPGRAQSNLDDLEMLGDFT